MSIFTEFPYTNYHELNLDWILSKIKELASEWAEMRETLETDIEDLKTFVITWFDENAPEEIREALDEMLEDGRLEQILNRTFDLYALGILPGNVNPVIRTQDCYLIKSLDGNILIDTGAENDTDAFARFFTERGVTSLNCIIITHYHLDHCGNLANVLGAVDVSNCVAYLPPDVDQSVASTTVYNAQVRVKQLLTGAGVEIKSDYNTYELGDIAIDFYNTNHSAYYADSDFNYNNCCLVPVLRYYTKKILFAADIDYHAQSVLASQLPTVDLASMAHHGYNEFYNYEYFSRIQPKIAMVCNGNGQSNADNGSYADFPDYVNRISVEAWFLENRGVPIYSTSQAPDNISHAVISPVDIQFVTNALPLNRISYHYNSFNEIFTNRWDAREARTKTIYQILNAMRPNSIVEGLIGSTYHFVPKNITDVCYMKIIKTSNGYISDSYSGDEHAIVIVVNRSNMANAEEQIYNFKKTNGSWSLGMRNSSMGNFYRYDVNLPASASNVNLGDYTYHFGNDITQTGTLLTSGLFLVFLVVNGTNINVSLTFGESTVSVIDTANNAKTMLRMLQLTQGDQLRLRNNNTTNAADVDLILIPIGYSGSWARSTIFPTT